MARNLSVKHLQTDKNGFSRYRRRVPDYAKAFVGEGAFVKVLGETENEALGNYGPVAELCRILDRNLYLIIISVPRYKLANTGFYSCLRLVACQGL